jgi:hypothetical protein
VRQDGPAPGAQSSSEVLMHITLANFYLLSVTGPPMPSDIKSNEMEKTVTAKPDVIDWRNRPLDALKTAREYQARRSSAQGQDCERRCHGGWDVIARLCGWITGLWGLQSNRIN